MQSIKNITTNNITMKRWLWPI